MRVERTIIRVKGKGLVAKKVESETSERPLFLSKWCVTTLKERHERRRPSVSLSASSRLRSSICSGACCGTTGLIGSRPTSQPSSRLWDAGCRDGRAMNGPCPNEPTETADLYAEEAAGQGPSTRTGSDRLHRPSCAMSFEASTAGAGCPDVFRRRISGGRDIGPGPWQC